MPRSPLLSMPITRLANGTYTFQNQLHSCNFVTYTLLDIMDKGTVSNIWDDSFMQWCIIPSDREGSYMYVILQISP
jgi:hypothetical protein